MRKYKKILLGLAFSLSLIFLSKQISLADEESSENPAKTETSENQGESGGEKDKLIITEEPAQSTKPPTESEGESELETNQASGNRGQKKEERPKEKQDELNINEGDKEEKTKNPPPSKEVSPPSKESADKEKSKQKPEKKDTNKLETKPETIEKQKAEANTNKAQNTKALEKDSDTKTEDGLRNSTNQEEPYIDNSNQGTETNTYLENQKNETLVLEVGPNDNKDKNKEINLKTRAELKDEGANADRIYIHLVGVFALALMAVILIKVIKTKNKEA
ncbi:MAG: hypothetical protein E7C95_06680 [Anaerococcus prevotii]|uniref:hypothetical protein n=1 Tax=Anaerococcus prevotii TaxID=33034 RepID=UPI002901DD1D|nr:hypothetical protein [Anaerococcus prevotii]MDU2558645.1 hypothetical protein [Anaerococcus prevotii]